MKFNTNQSTEDWAEAPSERTANTSASYGEATIFDLEPTTLTLDEGHMLRNRGNQHMGMLALRDRASSVMVATATPLHTAPRVC